jgi:D-alanyl-D-alanine dipeptidase
MTNAQANNLPDGFVYLKDIIPGIQLDMRYYGSNNFLGTRVDGYQQSVCIITKSAALALKNVQEELNRFGLGLKVFDAYRPQMAVDQFVRWADDPHDIKTKNEYYPDLNKQELIPEGYIAMKSSHSRGSTADLTIIDLATLNELDMGTRFDYFSPKSWPDNLSVSPAQRANRMLLQQIMLKHGFSPLKEEWWHFTLKSEPHPDQYFNFPVQ